LKKRGRRAVTIDREPNLAQYCGSKKRKEKKARHQQTSKGKKFALDLRRGFYKKRGGDSPEKKKEGGA